MGILVPCGSHRNFNRPLGEVPALSHPELISGWIMREVELHKSHLLYQIKQIEKVPSSADCFVTNNFSYHSSVTTMLEHLNWLSLEHWRSFLKLALFGKILPVLVDTITVHHLRTCGHSKCFTILFTKTDTYLNSFFPSTIKLWNSLRDSLVVLDDINQLKGQWKKGTCAILNFPDYF